MSNPFVLSLVEASTIPNPTEYLEANRNILAYMKEGNLLILDYSKILKDGQPEKSEFVFIDEEGREYLWDEIAYFAVLPKMEINTTYNLK